MIAAAALVWVPAMVLVGVRIAWTTAPTRVPSHFVADGAADAYSSSLEVFLICLAFSVAAGVCGIMMVIYGKDVRPLQRSITMGVLALVATAVPAIWVAMSLTAAAGGAERIGTPFLLVLAGVVWGGIVFLTAGPRFGPNNV